MMVDMIVYFVSRVKRVMDDDFIDEVLFHACRFSFEKEIVSSNTFTMVI